MQKELSLIAIVLSPLVVGGCALFHRLGDYAIVDDGAQEPASATITPSAPPEAEPASADDQGCQTNRDCAVLAATSSTSSQVAPAVCVKAKGRCERLLSPSCPRFVGDPSDEQAVVIGALLSSEREESSALEAAAFLAVEELNAANAQGGPSLVLVGCHASQDAISAARHLVDDLRVPAIVGPTAGADVVAVTQEVSSAGGTLVMTPSSVESEVSNLADGDLTWRALPSDAQRAKLATLTVNELETLLRATRGLETVKLGIVHPSDARGTSALEAIRGKLILNGRFITDPANVGNVSVDAHAAGDHSAESAIATRYAASLKPDIVFLTAAEQVTDFMVPFESALTAARVINRPYYVLTEAAKTDALLATIASGALPSDIRRRIRGVGITPDAMSAPILADFVAAYEARYGSPLAGSQKSSAALSYDTLYAIAYAMAAKSTVEPTGTTVAEGLRALGVGEPFAVGAKGAEGVLARLASGKSVSLRGTFGPMSWNASGDIAAGTLEVWCVGTRPSGPLFGSSGLTMDVETQVVGGAFVQCQ